MKSNQEKSLEYLAELKNIENTYESLMARKQDAAERAAQLQADKKKLLLKLSASTAQAEITRITKEVAEINLEIDVQSAVANSDISSEISRMLGQIAGASEKSFKEYKSLEKQAIAEREAIRKKAIDDTAEIERQLRAHPYHRACRLRESIDDCAMPKSARPGPQQGGEHWQTGIGWTE